MPIHRIINTRSKNTHIFQFIGEDTIWDEILIESGKIIQFVDFKELRLYFRDFTVD